MTHRRIIGATALALAVLILGAAVEAVPQIEGRLQAAVSDLLVRNGASWASASVEGRTVTLTGVPMSHEARLSVVALVRKVPGVSRVNPLVAEPIRFPLPEADTAIVVRDRSTTREAGGGGNQARTTVPAARLALDDQVVVPPATPSPPTATRSESCVDRLTRFAEERTLSFQPQGAAIADADKPVLVQAAQALRACGEWTLTLVGYAGSSEGRDSWALADRRAYAVARFLMAQGVDESRLATVTGTGSWDGGDFARVEIFVSGGQ